MAASGENLTIGAFADIAGVSVETIRFYQRKGLIRLPEKPFGGIRRYDAADVARVRFVKSAQRLGFSLDEVRGLLRLEDGTQCGEARQLAEQKLTEVRSKIADLVHIESVLDELVAECQTSTETVRCPLIDSLHGGGQSG